jgi:hypothetical protein
VSVSLQGYASIYRMNECVECTAAYLLWALFLVAVASGTRNGARIAPEKGEILNLIRRLVAYASYFPIAPLPSRPGMPAITALLLGEVSYERCNS